MPINRRKTGSSGARATLDTIGRLWYTNINKFVMLLYAVEDIDLRESFKLIFVFDINCSI